MISWARFVTFKGNPKVLTDANNQACGEEPTEYPLNQTVHKLPGFHGFNVFPQSKQDEARAWELIEKTCKERMNELQ